MVISLRVEGIPDNHKPYIVARLVRGKLLYYDSYYSRDRALSVVDRLENALMLEEG